MEIETNSLSAKGGHGRDTDMNIFLLLNSQTHHCAVGLKGRRLQAFSTPVSLETFLTAVTKFTKTRKDL